MGLQFYETVRGKNFFEYQLPRLIEAIEKLAETKTNTGTVLLDPLRLSDEETRKRLITVMNNPKKSTAFAKAFTEQFMTDELPLNLLGFNMARAMLNNNIGELLTAITGQTCKGLLDIAENGDADTQEVPTV